MEQVWTKADAFLAQGLRLKRSIVRGQVPIMGKIAPVTRSPEVRARSHDAIKGQALS